MKNIFWLKQNFSSKRRDIMLFFREIIFIRAGRAHVQKILQDFAKNRKIKNSVKST